MISNVTIFVNLILLINILDACPSLDDLYLYLVRVGLGDCKTKSRWKRNNPQDSRPSGKTPNSSSLVDFPLGLRPFASSNHQ